MKTIYIIIYLAFALGQRGLAKEKKELQVIGVEVGMSVGIWGGGSCYFGNDGATVYQRVIPDRDAGHGMIEKRYVMKDERQSNWRLLNQKFKITKILKAPRKTDEGVAGESTFTLRVYLSDGAVEERWAFTDDPITGVWMRMRETAWDMADSYIPLLIPYEQKNFGHLRRYLKEVEAGADQPANRSESKPEATKKLKPEAEGRSR